MERRLTSIALATLAALTMGAAAAFADDTPATSPLGSPFAPTTTGTSYSPLVPVSELGRPSGFLDPSRLKMSTEISFGTGYGGGTNGLQVMRFGYQFSAPLAMRVSVGNAFGPNTLQGNHLFLEGLDVAYRPFQSMLINVQYRNVRSPLQYQDEFGVNPYYGWPGR
jgi:hypothetical protein